MSEFIQEVASSVRMPDVSSFGQNVQTTVQQRVNSYYNRCCDLRWPFVSLRSCRAPMFLPLI